MTSINSTRTQLRTRVGGGEPLAKLFRSLHHYCHRTEPHAQGVKKMIRTTRSARTIKAAAADKSGHPLERTIDRYRRRHRRCSMSTRSHHLRAGRYVAATAGHQFFELRVFVHNSIPCAWQIFANRPRARWACTFTNVFDQPVRSGRSQSRFCLPNK